MNYRFKLFVFILLCNFSIDAQTITTVAGGGSSTSDGVPATSAITNLTFAGAFDKFGNYYFATATTSIKKIDLSGIISSVAGTSTAGYGGDGGPATAAQLHFQGFDLDSAGNIYIADYYNGRLRKVDAITGIISTIAGSGPMTSTGSGGPASSATVVPTDVIVGLDGKTLFLSEGTYIRKIDPSGIISIVAGNGTAGFSGDGGPATAAEIISSTGMCLDSSGNLFFAGHAGCRIRFIEFLSGKIKSFAGTGLAAYNGDNINADSANFKAFDIAFDSYWNLYIADYFNSRIRCVDRHHKISTVTGTGLNGFSGDGGPATNAAINYPQGLVFDKCGNLLIADELNNRIRKVSYPPRTLIAINLPSSAAVGSTVNLTANLYDAGFTPVIKWYNRGLLFATTTTPNVSYTKTQCVDSIIAKVYGCGDSSTSTVAIVRCNVGVTVAEAAKGIQLYPNPVSNQLTIESPTPMALITLTDLLGREVAKQTTTATSCTINVSHLPPGAYIVRIDGEVAGKVEKE